MENKHLSRLAVLFAIVLAGSFVYLYVVQNFVKPPLGPGVNTNTGQQPGGDTGGAVGSTGQSAMKKFATLEEFQKFITEAAAQSATSYVKGGPLALPGVPARGEVGASPSVDFPQDFAGFSEQSLAEGGGGGDFSQTNIQVQGVDEADIVKTDGRYVYAVSQNNLFIVDAYPAQDAQVLSKIQFKSNPQNIYINDNKLVVFGYADVSIMRESLAPSIFPPQSQFMFLKIFDVSDPKNPKQVRDLDFEGNYLNSRMIGDYVYLLTTKYSYQYIDDPVPLPRIIEDGERLLNDPKAPGFVFPDVYYFDIDYNGYSMTSVHAVNVEDASAAITSDTYALDPGQQLYVSQKNLYLTYTKHLNEEQIVYEMVKDIILPRLSQQDRERIEEIEKSPNYILTQEEKFNKIEQILERFEQSLTSDERKAIEEQLRKRVEERYAEVQKQLERTVIHKIAIDKNNLEYKGYGDVPGYVLNQYSMDEDGEFFRIATTRSRSWSPYAEDSSQNQSYSNLYVLDGALKVAGSIENLAPGEQIFSVRFMQSRAYLVTFQQTDPLFVVDLSNPRSPKILGELKIPGFSNYLHPYDETTLIGLGKETEVNQYGGVVTKGLKLSLFDVSDVVSPKEVAKYVVNNASSDSIALHEPKAFLFSKEKQLLVIPVTTYGAIQPVQFEGPVGSGITREEDARFLPLPPRSYFAGAYVFTVNKTSISLKGTIDHGSGQSSGNYYYSPGVQRSLYIKDALYTVSERLIKANTLEDLKEIKALELKKESSDDDFIIVN